MKNHNRTQFFKQLALLFFGAVFVSVLYAQLDIPTDINNAVQTIGKIVLTPNGQVASSTNPAVVTIDANASGAVSAVKVLGSMNISPDEGGINDLIGIASSIIGKINKLLGNNSFIVGWNNALSGVSSVIFGEQSVLTGNNSIILGGGNNKINGNYSTAGGKNTRTTASNTWAWNDGYTSYDPLEFVANTVYTFLIRAWNGVGINTANPQGALDVRGRANETGLVVTYGGNVGVGVASPSNKFQVGGNADIGLISTDAVLRVGWNDTNNVTFGFKMGSPYMQGVDANIGNGGMLAINPDGGNLGVGTSMPSAKLDVSGDAGSTGVLTVQGSAAAGNPVTLLVKNNNTVGTTISSLQMDAAAGNGGYLFASNTDSYPWGIVKGLTLRALPGQDIGLSTANTFGSLSSPSIMVKSSGNIGIGTSNPLSSLHVNGTLVAGGLLRSIVDGNDVAYFENIGNYTQFHMNNTAGGTEGYISINNNGQSNMGDASNDTTPGMQLWTPGNRRLTLGTSRKDRLTILGNGNVGIGTIAPGTKLYVDDGNGNGLTATMASNNPSFGFYDKNNSYYAAMTVNGTEMLFQKWSSPTTWVANPVKFSLNAPESSLILAGNGNVGMGTTNPSATLDVTAATGVTNAMTVQGSAAAGNAVTLLVKNNNTAGTTISSLQIDAAAGNGGYLFASNTDSYPWGIVKGLTLRALPGQDIGLSTASAFGSLSSPSIMVKTSGNVGVGTATPGEKLEVNGNIKSPGLYTKGVGVNAIGTNSTAIGYYAQAIGGYSTSIGAYTYANGYYSTAMGLGTQASDYSTAMGTYTYANGSYSTAMGYSTYANNAFTTSMGYNTYANGYMSTVMGYNTQANGTNSTAMGYNTQANGTNSTAMGYNTQANGTNSTAMGYSTYAIGMGSMAYGYGTKAYGYYSTAYGYRTTANSDYTTVMGTNNLGLSDSLLEIGNGTSTAYPYSYQYLAVEPYGYYNDFYGYYTTRWNTEYRTAYKVDYVAQPSNVLTVLKNGNVGIGVIPTSTLDVAGTLNVSTSITTPTLIVDKLVNRTITNIKVTGQLLPDIAAPITSQSIGNSTTHWKSLYSDYGYFSTAKADYGYFSNSVKSPTYCNTAGSSCFNYNTFLRPGTQTTNYLAKWNGSNVITSSTIYDDGTSVGIGKVPTVRLDVNGNVAASNITSTIVANNIVKRDANGYVWGNYFNTTANVETVNPTYIMGTFNADDGYLRKVAPGNVTVGYSNYAKNLNTDRTNWFTNGTISAVVGQLAWKNYSNGHTIFDASAGTSPAGTAISQTNAQNPWTATYPTLMGWNGSATYGVRVDSARIADTANYASSANYANSSSYANSATYADAAGYAYNANYAYNAGYAASAGYANSSYSATSSAYTTNISNAGTVTLGSASSNSNSITITQPSLATDQPVKLLNFNLSSTIWSLGNIRGSTSTTSNGFGIYLNSVEKLKIDSAGQLLAGGYFYKSDIILKKDIKSLDNALSKINQLNGYSFSWKSDGRKDIGVIAQEVEKVFPEIVHTNTDGIKSVEYGNLVAPIIEAIKSLTNKVTDLFAKYVDQEARIHSLEQRLQVLENK